MARSQRHDRPLALLMCDLDNFKSINDRFGHLVGDRVIINFVERSKGLLRDIDSLGRYGGEEFIVLLPETSLQDAKAIAERICFHISEVTVSELPRYTVSIGVAVAQGGGMAVDALLMEADRALYCAKENGRNQVHLAESLVKVA
jgi:diguanylate cyclase (GGDEF)-like protein